MGSHRPLPTVEFVLGTTTGGTGAHVRSLAVGMTARGGEVSVLGPAATQALLGFTAAGARFTPVEIADRPRPVRDIAAVLRLRRLLRQPTGSPSQAPRVVHAHGLRAGGLSALALGGVIFPMRRRGPAFVVTLHNAPPGRVRLAGMIYALLEWIVARRADRVLCVSGDLAARMRRRGARHAGRALVSAPATPGVSTETARVTRAELSDHRRPLVVAIGRLAPQKGFGTLVAAVARLQAHEPTPLVVIAGEGPLRAQLATQIDSERLPLKLLGQRSDVPALLAAADVFVLPSLWEGQPLILQEALRAGIPIVATRTGGIPDITGDDAALLVPPANPPALAAAVARVLSEPGLAARLIAAAAERARSLPGEQAAVDAVLAEYCAAIG